MAVYPHQPRYSGTVIPMNETTLLEPSFADAIAAIEHAKELAPSTGALDLLAAADRQGG